MKQYHTDYANYLNAELHRLAQQRRKSALRFNYMMLAAIVAIIAGAFIKLALWGAS